MKSLNDVLFPVSYSPKFYATACDPSSGIHCLVYYNGKLCGTMSAQVASIDANSVAHEHRDALRRAKALEKDCDKEERRDDDMGLRISTFGVLSPYRRRGIGRAMLQHLFLECELLKYKVSQALLHVHVINEEAIEFYLNCGFQNKLRISNYYRRLEPADCFLLVKNIESAGSSDEHVDTVGGGDVSCTSA